MKRAPPLVSEFREILHLDSVPSDHSCKVLTSQYTGEQSEMYKQSDTVDTNTEGQNPTKRAKKMYKVGVQHTPQQFFELAKTLTHPMTPEHSLPEVLKEAIHKNLTEPQVDLAKSRMRAILLIKSMAEDLEEHEEQLKRSMQSMYRRFCAINAFFCGRHF